MDNNKYKLFNIGSNDALKRIDNVIRKFLPNMPLKSIFKGIRSGDIRVNSKKVKQNYRLQEGDELWIYKMFLPHIKNNQEINKKIDNLDKNRIIFENEDILIYNKPSGLLMHGSDNSLELQVNEYLKDKIIETLSFSTGPLHRLDRNTQGLVVFSVSLKGARTFTMLIQNRSIRKKYIAIVDGRYNKKEIWEDRLSRDEKSLKTLKDTNGKYAKSIFTPIYSYKNMTLAVIEIETGRTHQIRAHASIHNRPLTGDKKYGSQSGYNSYFLSAASLTFTQKSDILTEKTFTIPLDLKAHPILKELLNSNNIQVVKDLIKRELNSL